MNVVPFPTVEARSTGIAEVVRITDPFLNVPDETLFELLRKAVAAHRHGIARARGSIANRHQLALSHAYLDAVEIMFQVPDLARELVRSLDDRVFDIRRLAEIARTFTGPRVA